MMAMAKQENCIAMREIRDPEDGNGNLLEGLEGNKF